MSIAKSSLAGGESGSRRALWFGLGRAMLTSFLLVVLYYLLPLDLEQEWSLWIGLTLTIVALIAVIVWQVRAIVGSRHPVIRGVEAFAVIGPLFLIVFASTYFVLSFTGPGNFNQPGLTRTDSLYFALTIFSTVGFGDIYAASQGARVVVMVQMLLDLLLIGVGIKIVTGAVKVGTSRRAKEAGEKVQPTD